MTEDAPERCDGCGLEIAGGTDGCQKYFEELLARDFADALRFGVHRMMVDVYSLQHPDRYCRSAKSLAAHLVGLCSILEHGSDRAIGSESLRRWLDGPSPVSKPRLPAHRGELTVDHLRNVESPDEYAIAVDEWARSTWKAFEPLHDVAREWLSRSQTEASHRGGRH